MTSLAAGALQLCRYCMTLHLWWHKRHPFVSCAAVPWMAPRYLLDAICSCMYACRIQVEINCRASRYSLVNQLKSYFFPSRLLWMKEVLILWPTLFHEQSEASNNNAVNVSKFSKAPRPVTKLSN